ncbi:glycoside hydrolase family 26 protein [Microbaculum marinisediminis]|uniref:Beta-mannosidase n=1 Tax=Microbaculum marinisediminis TaxID=2931392 RepID=A0AAW5QVE1_9HYPH|nr:glycosyl hydrolase [Microbaculum sp. A6E488]MCT8970962.1 beta-mannosidase [Microbaculum sp. A6E488]
MATGGLNGFPAHAQSTGGAVTPGATFSTTTSPAGGFAGGGAATSEFSIGPGSIVYAPQPKAKQDTNSEPETPIGIYDPLRKAKRVRGMEIEHVFIPWHEFDAAELQHTARYARKRKRRMMITVEPWTNAPNRTDGGENLFGDIVAGAYDETITSVCTEIKKVRRRPLVRWGHEMEEVTGRYPWARYDSAGYIKAYRYFVSTCREIASKARFVWSPIGHEGLDDYYPGSAYVDMIGFPVWGYRKADQKWYGHARTFGEAVREKYNRVKGYGKPMILAEIGISGPRGYERRWVKGMKKATSTFSRLKAVVYFNMLEPAAWPDGLGKPDWRIKPRLLR